MAISPAACVAFAETRRVGIPCVPDPMAQIIEIQRMAARGRPLTKEDRLARQVIANHLTFSPEVYNFLVFGETEKALHKAPAPATPTPHRLKEI